MSDVADLSIIDLSVLHDGSPERVADTLNAECKRTGFAYLVGHGIPDELVKKMQDLTRAFFDLPMDTKLEIKRPEDPMYHQGYIKPHQEQTTPYFIKDYTPEEKKKVGKLGSEAKESFQCTTDPDPQLPPLWLREDALPGFKATCHEMMEHFRRLQLEVLKVIAHGISGCPIEELEKLHSRQQNQFRVAKYIQGPWHDFETKDITWINPHADTGFFTFLIQEDDKSGLEIENPNERGSFEPIKPIPGSIVFNVGSTLGRLSNDEFRPTMHRVRPLGPAPGEDYIPPRHSIVYFGSVNKDAVIDALPGTYSDDNPKKYEPVVFGEWLAARVKAWFD